MSIFAVISLIAQLHFTVAHAAENSPFTFVCASKLNHDVSAVENEDLGFAKSYFYMGCVKQLKRRGLVGLDLHNSCNNSNILCKIELKSETLSQTDCREIEILRESNTELIIPDSIFHSCQRNK